MEKKDLIIVRIEKGLGNQLFEYAFARAWKEKGLDVRLDLDKTYADAFQEDKRNDPRRNRIQEFNITLPAIDVEEYGRYAYLERRDMKDKAIFCLAEHGLWKYRFFEETVRHQSGRMVCPRGNCYVRAWFQDERYFRHIRGILLREFTPKRRIRVPEGLRHALGYPESVAVHVRRGDYAKIHHTLNASYYDRAMSLIRQRYRSPLFLIFSDDLDWAKRSLAVREDCIYVNEDRTLEDYEELMIMSRCRSVIISNSTFSWWGAWLDRDPEKIVIAPRRPWLSKQGNIIPEGWIAI